MTLSTRIAAGLTGALACLAVAAPAQADWGGGTAQSAASAYCGARSSGLSQKEASKHAFQVMSGSMRGSFTSNIATIITSHKGMKSAVEFQINQMCPEYGNQSSVRRLEATPIMPNGCYYGDLCKKLGL